jgi:hypothetical protein
VQQVSTPPVTPDADIIVERLARPQFRTVYPLMREAAPALSLPRWLQYAGSLSRGTAMARKGVLVARRRAALHPCGAVCYRSERHMTSGSMLTAEHFIAVDLLYPEAIIAALLTELDGVAASLGCTSIRSIMHGGRAGLLEDLQAAGHSSDGITLLKPVKQ